MFVMARSKVVKTPVFAMMRRSVKVGFMLTGSQLKEGPCLD